MHAFFTVFDKEKSMKIFPQNFIRILNRCFKIKTVEYNSPPQKKKKKCYLHFLINLNYIIINYLK